MQALHHLSNAASLGLRSPCAHPAIALIILFLIAPGLEARPIEAEPLVTSGCTTSSPSSGAYSVTVCITSPSSGATLTGNATVTATVSVTGSTVGVQRVVFRLGGAYLLTDYLSPYSFTLPTATWTDGSYTIAVSAAMRDDFVSANAVRSVKFHNGVTATPVPTTTFKPTSGRAPNGLPFVVAAAGDGASGETYSGKVASMLKSINPNLFLYLGDVYENGSVSEFYNWYGNASSYFSAFRGITDPTVGNHEYLTTGASAYYQYWGNVPKYYSFNAYGWHFISLNSNNSYVSTVSGSAQYNWLQKDLASLPSGKCTVVYYHHPLYNIGLEGSASQMSAMWKLMVQYGVDIVLNGHDHDYQRWKPLDGNGNVSSHGITEFVVGTAGHGLQTFVRTDSRVAYSNDSNPKAFGVLLLTLHSTSANFSYENTAGTILDSGSIPCVSSVANGPASSASIAGATPNITIAWASVNALTTVRQDSRPRVAAVGSIQQMPILADALGATSLVAVVAFLLNRHRSHPFRD